MKYALLAALLLLPTAYARETVLLTGFTPFGRAQRNNSWEVAQAAAQNLRQQRPDLDVHTCLLDTTFRQAAVELDACIQALPTTPAFVLSLGEGPCKVHFETQVYNLDHNPKRPGISPDNEGVYYTNHTIIPGAPFRVGLAWNPQAAYCSLSPKERAFVKVSSTPGNFVCNNAAYQTSFRHPEINFAFTHVIGQACGGNRREMIAKATNIVTKTVLSQLPQTQVVRLPVDRGGIEEMSRAATSDCEKQFYADWLKNLFK